MGCISTKPSNRKISDTFNKSKARRISITSSAVQRGPGVIQLKQNYHIDFQTKVLGSGSFGKVFMTTNKHDKNFKVAIKVIDKEKLG